MSEEILDRIWEKLPPYIESRLLTLAEPEKRSFRIRRYQSGPITRILHRANHDSVHCFRTPTNRDTFLWAVLNHLKKTHDKEWLVIGLGRRLGIEKSRPSKIEGMWVGHGNRGQVGLTPLGMRLIKQQTQKVKNGEVILIHNHLTDPFKWIVGQFIGWTPLPSEADRQTAFKLYIENLKTLSNKSYPGFYRFYLVEEGRLREFFLPPVNTLLEVFRAVIYS